ncbi:MAG: four helix bundle protein [Chryseobacterium sp.]|nr:four helix bundle protein [Chryseobacterium sp.]
MEIWQNSQKFCESIHQYYPLEDGFQRHDKTQIGSAYSSIMHDITEGFKRYANRSPKVLREKFNHN